MHITCNMCTPDIPDVYALSCRVLGIHIRQIPRAHYTTITCIASLHAVTYSHVTTITCIASLHAVTYSYVNCLCMYNELIIIRICMYVYGTAEKQYFYIDVVSHKQKSYLCILLYVVS